MITIEKIQDTSGFLALRQEWTNLLEYCDDDCLFLSWDWMFTWWRRFSTHRQLCIITVRKAGLLIAVAPMVTKPTALIRLQPFKAIEFLASGDVGSDYLTLILRKGFELEAAHELIQALKEKGMILDLSNFNPLSETMKRLTGQLQGSGWRSTKSKSTVCPFINLRSHDWESFISSRGKSHRANTRKRLRRLNDCHNEITFKAAATDSERRRTMQLLVHWHLARWKERGGSTALHRKELVQFHDDFTDIAMAKGWLRLFLLSLDDQPVAAIYCFNYRKKYYFYQMGYDEQHSHLSIGLVATALAIQSALQEGAVEYDFLHGDEQYKYLWANEERELIRQDLFPPSLTEYLYQLSMQVRDELKGIVRSRPHAPL